MKYFGHLKNQAEMKNRQKVIKRSTAIQIMKITSKDARTVIYTQLGQEIDCFQFPLQSNFIPAMAPD